jgi:hypothetical protein
MEERMPLFCFLTSVLNFDGTGTMKTGSAKKSKRKRKKECHCFASLPISFNNDKLLYDAVLRELHYFTIPL